MREIIKNQRPAFRAYMVGAALRGARAGTPNATLCRWAWIAMDCDPELRAALSVSDCALLWREGSLEGPES